MKYDNDSAAGFFGADVASAHVDFARHGEQAVQRVANNVAAIKQWLRQVPAGAVLAMEATGRYHQVLARLAHEHGLRVYVLNPRDVKHYARGVGQRGKTDRLDARLVARYIAREHAELHAWQLPDATQQRLSELLRRRATLVRHHTALRQSAAGDTSLGKLLAKALQPLKSALAQLDRQIAQAVNELPDGAMLLECVTSVPGIGPLNGAALLRLFHRLGQQANADAVVAFTGLDPRPMDSGNKRGQRRLSKRGDAELRRLLFNAARAAAGTQAWKAQYERHCAKGLSRTAALVVLARKLLRVAFALFKARAKFEPTRLQAHPASALVGRAG